MANKLILPAKTEELDKVQLGWLNFAHLKTTTFDALEKDELAVQQILLDFDKIEELEDAQDKLKQAKGLATESEGRRLHLTNMLRDKVTNPAMEYEKRNAVLIKAAEAHELTLRKAAVATQEKEGVIEREKNALKAHIESEQFRIAAKYRQDLEILILEAYKNALKNKTPVKEMKAYKKAIEGFLKDEKLDKFIKYDIKHITKETAAATFKSVPAYEKDADLKAAIGSIDEVFAMYAEDLKNKTKAIKKAEEKMEEVEAETTKAVDIQTSMNTLSAEAVPLVMTGGATIKKNWKVVEENTPEWAVAVITSYMTNLVDAKKHVRVSSWSKFTIDQMAKALAKVKTEYPLRKFEKITFKQIEK